MNALSFADTPLAGLKCIMRIARSDERGFLSRLFDSATLASAGWPSPIRQINHTYTRHQGSVRGMHYQRPPHSEAKVVSCIRGRIWDVAVDLRVQSGTFLSWHAQELSADNGLALLIPQGFAHGFQALSDDVEMIYCHSADYAQESERGLHPLDAKLAIKWPHPVRNLSQRDSTHPLISDNFEGVTL